MPAFLPENETQQTHSGDYTSEAGTDDSRSFSTTANSSHASGKGSMMIGKKIQLPWESMFGMLLQFYESNGHSNVLSVGKSGENTLLAPWAREQQLYFQQKLQEEDISPEDLQRISKLDSIGFFSWSSLTTQTGNDVVESPPSNLQRDEIGPTGATIKVPPQPNQYESVAFRQQDPNTSVFQESHEDISPKKSYYENAVPSTRGYQFPDTTKNQKDSDSTSQGQRAVPPKKRMAFRKEETNTEGSLEPVAKKHRSNSPKAYYDHYGPSHDKHELNSKYSPTNQVSKTASTNVYGPQSDSIDQYSGDYNNQEGHPHLPDLTYEWLLSRTGKKLRSCRHYQKQGYCAHGRGCTFAHVIPPGEPSSNKGKFYEEQVETTKCRDPSGTNDAKTQQSSQEGYQWYGPQEGDGKDVAYSKRGYDMVEEHKDDRDVVTNSDDDHFIGFRLPSLSSDWLFDHSRLAYKRCRNHEAGFCKNPECTFAHVQKASAIGTIKSSEYDELNLECRCGKDSEGSFWFTAGYIHGMDFIYASGNDGAECSGTGLWWYKSGDSARAAVRARAVYDDVKM